MKLKDFLLLRFSRDITSGLETHNNKKLKAGGFFVRNKPNDNI